MSLDEYVEACGASASISVDFAEVIDPDEFAVAAAAQIEILESIEPPAEVAALHDALLAYLRALQDKMADAPDGEGGEFEEFLFSAVFSLAFEHGPAIERAAAAMAPEVRERLEAAGCLDGEETSEFDDEEFLDRDDEVTPDGAAPAPAADTAPPAAGSVTSVEGDDPSAEVGVPPPIGPSSPSNVNYAVESSAIRLSWDSVAEADYYNVYHDDFFDSACSLDHERRASFCSELAGNVVDTTFVHASPSLENYYWVVACNRDGCSEIDSHDPVTVIRSGTAPAVAADTAGAATDTEPGSAPAYTEPAPPPEPDETAPSQPEEPAPVVVHECPTTWDDSPTLTVAELLTACGGDAAALAARATQECAAEDISAAGNRARANAENARQHAANARERAERVASRGDEDLAEHYEDSAQHYEELALHHLDLALDAENRERDRRDRVMASRGATTWEQACEIMVDRVWAADHSQAASLGRAFLTHLAILGDVICGGPDIDYADLCGGVDLLNVLESSLDALTGGIESIAGIIEAATDFF